MRAFARASSANPARADVVVEVDAVEAVRESAVWTNNSVVTTWDSGMDSSADPACPSVSGIAGGTSSFDVLASANAGSGLCGAVRISYHQGADTAAGRTMNQLLSALGAPVGHEDMNS
jgi:hypothetical protein